MKTDDFGALIQRFFADYLEIQLSLSAHTIAAYRDTFRLLLTFLSGYHYKDIDQLALGDLSAKAVLAFLEHLEHSRSNVARTRNVRLAAIRTFVRFVTSQVPVSDFLDSSRRILSIPLKKSPTRMLGFLDRQEVETLLASTDQTTWFGRRDQLLFLFLYNTGARVGEALQLHERDCLDRSVLLHGKGRKERVVPLWRKTDRMLRRWCRCNKIGTDQPVFTNRWGSQLSRDGVALRLSLAMKKASKQCPSLVNRKITPHTLRHTCAMHLLQSGVALEVIALWLGHEKPITTHLYIETDLKLKKECLNRLQQPGGTRNKATRESNSRLLAFLEAI